MYTVTPPITASPTKMSVIVAPVELSLPTWLGLIVGTELGLLCVADGVGDGDGVRLGELPECLACFFLWPDGPGDCVCVGDD